MNPELHEHTDVSARLIAFSLAGIAATAVIAGLLMAWLFAWYGHEQPPGPAISPLAGSREVPPLPRLQVSPQYDWREYEQLENRKLATYKWIDKNSGTVRIPIDRAMDLIAARGIAPVPKTAAPPAGARQPSAAQPSLPAGPIGAGGATNAPVR